MTGSDNPGGWTIIETGKSAEAAEPGWTMIDAGKSAGKSAGAPAAGWTIIDARHQDLEAGA